MNPYLLLQVSLKLIYTQSSQSEPLDHETHILNYTTILHMKELEERELRRTIKQKLTFRLQFCLPPANGQIKASLGAQFSHQ